MCGILCYIHCKNKSNQSPTEEYDTRQWHKLETNVARRGPDSLGNHSQELNDSWYGKFVASVLWMQGSNAVYQPCTDDDQNILLWNGDIFNGSLVNEENESDTLTLLMKLKTSNNILETINSIEGPFSLVYFQKSTNLLYFTRDKIGRHSLLIKINQEHQSLMLSSVAHKVIDNIIELPAIGVFVANLQNSNMILSYYPWEDVNELCMIRLKKFEYRLGFNIRIEPSILNKKINDIIFEPNPEEVALLESLSNTSNADEIMNKLLQNVEVSERVTNLLELLRKSIKVRLRTTPQYCKNCIKHVITNTETFDCNHPKVGILFSGGLDSTILAAIANEFIPSKESIDLINVAFEKVKADVVNNKKMICTPVKFDVPDRKTGHQALQELQRIYPSRMWNFIEVNVSRVELQSQCGNHICNLIYPVQTILDESLGCAVWFGSRGYGIIQSSNELYESPCRILLLGMGADELFGGYVRHRTTLRHHGWVSLTKELQTELSRISERNLGRDDRVVSDHGRQSRLPYLDENLVQYVQSLKPWERCYPTENFPPGLGDKLLLRLVAYKIGLRETTNFPKRAFQFGSRIANSKQNATDLSLWLR